MAKDSVEATLNPLALNPAKLVLVEDAIQVLRAINYAASRSPTYHGGALAAGPDWHDGAALGRKGLGIVVDHAGLNGWEEVLTWPFKFDSDVQAATFAAACYVIAGTTIGVRCFIDGVQIGATLSFTSAGNGVQQAVSEAAPAPGWHIASVEVARTAGASVVSQLVEAHLEDDTMNIAAVPDPTG